MFYNPKTDSTWQEASSHRCGYVRFNGFRVHFLDWGGKGPAIVFLPELGASAHVFDDFALPFTQRFRVVAVTPPAAGQSDTPDSPLSIDYVANAVLAVLDSLGIERAHFIGHSFAGTVITRIGVLHPRRVRSLVYLDGAFDFGPDAPSPRESRDERLFVNSALEANLWANLKTPEETERDRKGREDLLSDAASHPNRYSEVRAPALAIWATKSIFTVMWASTPHSAGISSDWRAQEFARDWETQSVDRFRREMKHGRVVAYPGAHEIFLTEPGRTYREVLAFLLER